MATFPILFSPFIHRQPLFAPEINSFSIVQISLLQTDTHHGGEEVRQANRSPLLLYSIKVCNSIQIEQKKKKSNLGRSRASFVKRRLLCGGGDKTVAETR